MDPEASRDLPGRDQQQLLSFLGVDNITDWEQNWRATGLLEQTLDLWPAGASPDWLWSIGLPLLTEAGRPSNSRRLIGLSALPGCGKTTLGHWLERAAACLDLPLQVVSIDDFYFEAQRLDQAMQGNPWQVPRALPGSHDIPLLQSTLTRWLSGAAVELPCFDKSLRQGRGDRSGWRPCSADVLVFEGWFVGCEPLPPGESLGIGSDHLLPPISPEELLARQQVQVALGPYQPIWTLLDSLWQIRAQNLSSSQRWKQQQEDQMLRDRGVALDAASLQGFVRMILSAIPAESFQRIKADVCFEVDPDRRLRRIRTREQRQDSLSSVSLTG